MAINVWPTEYNHIRPYTALGMLPPAPETLLENEILLALKLGARQEGFKKL